MKKQNKSILIGPIVVIGIIIITIMIASLLLSGIGFEGQKTAVVNGALETSLITVNNILSFDGIQFLVGSAVTNFQIFEPLVLLILSIIGIGVLEKSGLLSIMVAPFRKLSSLWLGFGVVLLGILFTVVGDYSYLLLLPLIPLAYKYLGKQPLLGLTLVFLGITLGHGSAILYNYDDYTLGLLTQEAAKVNVDKNYVFELTRTLFISITSAVSLAFLISFFVHRRIAKKLPRYKEKEELESVTSSKKAFVFSMIAVAGYILLIGYFLIPGYPLSGVLLDPTGVSYFEKIFSPNAPFLNGFAYLLLLGIMLVGFVYGKVSNNIKNTVEFSSSLSTSFHGFGYVVVLLFFLSQLTAILDWTNIGEVFASKMIAVMSTLEFSGIALIITMFLFVIVMSIMIPETLPKWILMAPLIVPLFMRSNITPDFTQFIFVVADGIGKSLSPIFIYLIITIGLFQKYQSDDSKPITLFGTMRLFLPVILIMAGIWLLILIGWYMIGLPLGLGGYATL